MKKIFLIAFIALLSTMAMAQNSAYTNFCTSGATKSLTSGLPSSNLMLSAYTGCLVSVYFTGNTTPVTIYSDALGTPLTNPFTANTITGQYLFYAANGTVVDIVMSGGLPIPGIISPTPLVGVPIGGGGGGGGLTGSGTANTIAKWTGTSSLGNSLLVDNGTTATYSGTGGIAITAAPGIAGALTLTEGSPVAGVLGSDVLWADSAHHQICTNNNAAGTVCLLSGGIGTSTPGQALVNVANAVAGTDLSTGLYNNGWSMDAENTFSGLYGVGCFGDSNCAGFGTSNPGTGIGSTNWINQVANDIGGGTVFNYALSGDNPSGAATKTLIALSALSSTGNPLMFLDIGENTGRQGIINASWTKSYLQYMTSAAVWPSIPATSKYIVSDSTKWTPTGSWSIQQSFVRSDVGATNSGWGYQVGDPIQGVCPIGTALTYTVSGVLSFPLAGTIGGTNTGYTPGVYTNVSIAGGSGVGFVADITVGAGGNVTAVTTDVVVNRGGYIVGDTFPLLVGGGTNATYTATIVGGPFAASTFSAFGNNLCSSIGGLQSYNTAPINLGSGAVFSITYGAIQPFVSTSSGNTLTTVLPVDVPPNGVAYLHYAQWADTGGTFTFREDSGSPLVDSLTGSATLSAQYDPTNYTLCNNQLGFVGSPIGSCVPQIGSGTPNAAVARFTGLTPGFHNFTITQTSSGKVGVVSLEFPPSAHYRGAGAPGILIGGLKQVGFGDQTTEQYYSKLNEQVSKQLISDGLNTPFFVENTLDPSVDFLSAQVAYVSDCSITAGIGHFDFAPLLPTGVNQYFPGWVGNVNTNGVYPIFSGACAPFNGATLTILLSGLTPTAFNFNYAPASSTPLISCSSNGTNATVKNSGQNFLYPGWTGVVGGFSGACAPLNSGSPITILSTGFSQTSFQFAYGGAAISNSTDAGTLTSVVTSNLSVSSDTGSFVPTTGNSYNGTTANTGNQSIVGHLSTGPNGGTTHMAGLAEAAARSFGFTSGTTALGGGLTLKPTVSGLPGIGINTNAGALHNGTGWFPGVWNYADTASGLVLGMNAEPITAFTSYGGPISNSESNILISSTLGGTGFVSYIQSSGSLPTTPSVATLGEFINSVGISLLPTAAATSGSNKGSTVLDLYQSTWNGTAADGTHHARISAFATGSGTASGNVLELRVVTNTPANTGDQYVWLDGNTQGGWRIDTGALGSNLVTTWSPPTMSSTIAMPTQGSSGFAITGFLSTTAATSDIVSMNGMISSGHCSVTPTNSTAATNIASVYYTRGTGQITVFHTATASMTFDIVCYAF